MSSKRRVDIRNALLMSAMAASLGFKGLHHPMRARFRNPPAPPGFLLRIDACRQFTRFEGIQQVHSCAGRDAAGRAETVYRETGSTLPPRIRYRKVYG
jgi:hypothetical protein